ncbi:MAG: zf-HC2 domain-containing protein [Gemmatimonadota bacterium]
MSEQPRNGQGGIAECGSVRDLLPLRAAGALDSGSSAAVETHLLACEDCADEARFVQSLAVARPEPPADLVRSVLARLPEKESAGSRDWADGIGRAWRRAADAWPLAMAASFILALGVGTMWMDRTSPSGAALVATMMEDEGRPGTDEWMVAGAPVWDALPDDVLLVLLEEEPDA